MASRLISNATLQKVALGAVAAAAAALSLGASAQDFSFSGFGTLGYAVSDKDYEYQRFINDNGTLKRDSVAGAQMDVRFTPEWSATLQGKVAPAIDDDSKWKASVAWAFVSWRPNNEWLVRAGKVRLPLYLFSENLDVGQSYDFARMPTEMYSISPTTDIAGLYLTHNWAFATSDLSLDVYSGRAPRVVQRIYSRDVGVQFEDVSTRVTGAVLTLRSEDSTWRAGLHHAASKFNGPSAPASLQYQPLPIPGLGYYVPATYTDKFSNDIFTVGFDMNLSPQWRVIAEYERNFQHDLAQGANTSGGYVSLLRKFDKFTPYVALSKLKTLGSPARAYESLSQLPNVPSYIPGGDQINAGQRRLLDSIPYFDQESLALGMSYTLTPQSKLKAEFMHTWVGKGSAMIDSPAGGPPVAHEGINVLSFSYNFAF
jgi:hypothetical protein